VFADGPPAWPIPDDDVRAALLAAYADGTWGQYHGPHCRQLSERLAQMHALEHALLCSSGTIGVQLALRGVGVGPGDEVLLAGYDFGGNFRAIETIGAVPVLVDVDPQTWSFDPETVAAARSPKTRAIVASHLHGGLVPMRRLRELADSLALAVVEDACQCPGAQVDGRLTGSWGDAGVMSFGGSKLLTAGRGGAVLTSRSDVAQRIRIHSEQGNHAFPLSELQAAVLLPQLDKLAARNETRRANVVRLLQQLSSLRGWTPVRQDYAAGAFTSGQPAYYKLAWLVEPGERLERADWMAALQAEGVAIDAGFRGFTHRSTKRCRKVGPLPESQRASIATLVLHHPVLLESPQVIDCVAEAIGKVARALAG